MRLAVYSSKPGTAAPNLVAIQDARFDLPTVLVCPLQEHAMRRNFRAVIRYDQREYVALCDLARPIHRRVLRPLGELPETDSRRVIETFVTLLAR